MALETADATAMKLVVTFRFRGKKDFQHVTSFSLKIDAKSNLILYDEARGVQHQVAVSDIADVSIARVSGSPETWVGPCTSVRHDWTA